MKTQKYVKMKSFHLKRLDVLLKVTYFEALNVRYKYVCHKADNPLNRCGCVRACVRGPLKGRKCESTRRLVVVLKTEEKEAGGWSLS